MASNLKTEELKSLRGALENLHARLHGDLGRMTDEALRSNLLEGTSNLSNVPSHMADVGTENYDQEFTLGLIQNEQVTLEQVDRALDRMEKGTYGACVECGGPIAKPRLAAIPYTEHCIQCARKLEEQA